MNVRILGTRAKIDASAAKHSNYSGVLLNDEILLDIGMKKYLEYNPEYIFITHLHPDHAFFVEEKETTLDIPVYAPEIHEESSVAVEVIDDEMNVNGYNVTPIPTHHSKLVESQAYVVEKNSTRLLYTGDIIWIDKKYHDTIMDLDLVITDGSYYRKGGLVRKDKETGALYGHTGIKDLVSLFKDFTDNIVFTHLGSWFYHDIDESKQKIRELSCDKLEVDVAYDGMEINL